MPNNTNTIEPCGGWRVGDALFPILDQAQKAALCAVLGCDSDAESVQAIVEHRAEVIKILSMEAPKPRKPRADRGTKRTRKIAPVAPGIGPSNCPRNTAPVPPKTP